MNEGLTGLEQLEGLEQMMMFNVTSVIIMMY